ncbi:DUF6531 domain-containing protein [Nonomuraea muscovyensis]|uniref:DUF6531 domain-containing protein n=1 Tax=Nonomuraea muscovyensis TaxID=1124761 RepID=UPI0035E43539
MFGAGWSSSWDMKIVREERAGRAFALWTRPDGRKVRFAARDGSGVFQPPPGMQATLSLVPRCATRRPAWLAPPVALRRGGI